MTDKIITFAPATVGNVGPFYDVLGYALNDVGDFVELEKTDLSEDLLLWNDTVKGTQSAQLAGLDYVKNSPWIAASRLLDRHWNPQTREFSLRMTLHKYVPIGSGIGSSAASAAAAVKAVVEMLALRLLSSEVIGALELAEEESSGTGHPENVVPSYFGGLFVINEDDICDKLPGGGRRYTKINGGESMISVIVCPEVSVRTRESRTAVRERVYRQYIDPRYADPDKNQAAISILSFMRRQSAKAAEFTVAFIENDIARVGALMNDNELLEYACSPLIPNFSRVKMAALEAGAYGCTLSGSGPAMVSITDSDETAVLIRDAMRYAFHPVQTRWLISRVNANGASVVKSVGRLVQQTKTSNNFYD